MGGPTSWPKVRKAWKKPISPGISSFDEEEEEMMMRPE